MMKEFSRHPNGNVDMIYEKRKILTKDTYLVITGKLRVSEALV